MVLPPLGASCGRCPPGWGGTVVSPALGPMAVWCLLVVLAGRQQGHRLWVQVKLDRRRKVVSLGEGVAEGRSPPRVTRGRGPRILGCSCVSGTTHKQ